MGNGQVEIKTVHPTPNISTDLNSHLKMDLTKLFAERLGQK